MNRDRENHPAGLTGRRRVLPHVLPRGVTPTARPPRQFALPVVACPRRCPWPTRRPTARGSAAPVTTGQSRCSHSLSIRTMVLNHDAQGVSCNRRLGTPPLLRGRWYSQSVRMNHQQVIDFRLLGLIQIPT